MKTLNRSTALLLAGVTVALGGCGKKDHSNSDTVPVTTDSSISQTPTTPTDTTVAKYQHHSVLGGAVAGAAAGHVLGKHAIAGAAVGAIIQHERNKHDAARR